MAADTTRLNIELVTLLRGLSQTLRGLDQIKKRLDSVANIKVNTQTTNQATTAAQRLAQQQQRLSVQAQELANRQERARQTTERLALSQQRLTQSQQQSARVSGQQADAHVRAFRALEDAARKSRAGVLTLDQVLSRVGGSLRNLGLGLTSLGSSLTLALTAPLTALGVVATRNAVTLDSLKRGLTAITGSADEAGVQLQRLTQIAKLPGIGFQEAIQGSIRLQAVGFSAEKAEKALREFSNAVALTGGGRDELNRITVQLGQLSAKGKVLSQDLKPIIEAGPAVGRALKQAFGTVNAEDIQALGLTSEQFLDQLVSQLSQLPRAAAGAKNTFDNFADAVFRASAAIGDAIIPVLTNLITIVEPVITGLANGFKSLPPVIQTITVAFGGLLAGLGPVLFIVGQLATGIGGVISGFSRILALTQTLIPAINATTAALTAQQAAAAGVAASLGALGLAAAAIVAAVGVFILLSRAQKDAVKVSQEQIAATDAQIASLKDQIKFTNSLSGGVERTAEEQDRLAQIYSQLNTQAKIRLTAITDEEKRLAALREELQRVLNLRNEERIQQAANLTASLADTVAQIDANERSRNSIAVRVRANTELADSIRVSGQLTVEQRKQIDSLNLTGLSAAQIISELGRQNEKLIGSQGELITKSRELNGTAEEQATALRVLQQQTGLSARELLSAAKSMGVFKGDIDAVLPSIEKYIKLQREAADANTEFQKSLNKAGDDLLKAGERGDAAGKRRQALIEAAATIARETSVDFKGALKSLKQEVDAVVELRQALQRESELTGKSVEQILTEALTKGLDKGGTALRDARERLAAAILETQQAQAESELTTQKIHNEEQLDANELSYKLQLRSYREYLEARAILTDANLALESQAAAATIATARKNEVRLRQSAAKPGIPETERIKRLAQAEKFNEEAIRAETKLAEVQRQRNQIEQELKQTLAELSVQQLKDVRQLEIEYGELTGRVEDALNAATVEKYRAALEDLGKTQDFLNRKLTTATQNRDADLVQEITAALQLNQRQIDAINNIVRQEQATNRLAAANEFVRRAKEKQSDLETQLAFEVEFRGLKEEEAIRRRLAGERELANRLTIVRDLVQDQVDQLNAAGAKPPQALLDFIRETNTALKGLGELSFNEQFRLVEKEFNRLNDERLRKIADIERAIRERDIAEAEGLLIIRRINGQYSADLERQVELLKQIAAASNDASLQQQAQQAEQTTKDANSQLADFNRQLRSTSIDALRDGFTDFFASLADRTKTAKEKLLDLVSSVAKRINDLIAENLSKKLIESLFGDGTGGQGILASLKDLFGGAGQGAVGGVGAVAAAGVSQATQATAAATALTTGATAAAAALTTGGTTAGATLAASLTAAAASFSAAVIAAGAAFAAAVGAASAAQGVSSFGAGFAPAATGLFPAVPGGVVRIVEGGFPEAVLTTDPKHASRQLAILREFLQRTRGLGGRVKGLATGGFAMPDLALNVPGVTLPSGDFGNAEISSPRNVSLRILNLLDKRQLVGGHLRSAEGAHDIMNVISEHADEIGRRIGIK